MLTMILQACTCWQNAAVQPAATCKVSIRARSTRRLAATVGSVELILTSPVDRRPQVTVYLDVFCSILRQGMDRKCRLDRQN